MGLKPKPMIQRLKILRVITQITEVSESQALVKLNREAMMYL
jgi:hypothetical protein